MEINDALLQYLDQLTPMNHELLEEMERVALEQHVPIIDRPSAQLIGTILRYKGNVQRVLEIGTGDRLFYALVGRGSAIRKYRYD